jgi:hypothetical protein
VSDPPQVILLDSNAYFRLARSIRPLLAGTFGAKRRYSLCVLQVLDREYLSNARLHNKFEWVTEREYRADREAKRYRCQGRYAAKAERAFSFLAGYAREHRLNVAPEDLRALAVGFVRGIPVVTDDIAMQQVASANDIPCWSSLRLLRLMQTEGRIGLDLVRQVLEYLAETNDLPMPMEKLRAEYRLHFAEDCPV